MTTLAYPVKIEADGNQFMASFPDVPEALTGAETFEETEQESLDALVTALASYYKDGKHLPKPSQLQAGQRKIHVPALAAAKLELHRIMMEQGITCEELARRLGLSDNTVSHLLDFNHQSHLDQIENALAVLGQTLEVRINT